MTLRDKIALRSSHMLLPHSSSVFSSPRSFVLRLLRHYFRVLEATTRTVHLSSWETPSQSSDSDVVGAKEVVIQRSPSVAAARGRLGVAKTYHHLRSSFALVVYLIARSEFPEGIF